MLVFKGIKKHAKKILAAASLAGVFFGSPKDVLGDELRDFGFGLEEVSALEKAITSKGGEERIFLQKFPGRVISPHIISNNDLANPRGSFEANYSSWDTVNALIGKGGDLLGRNAGLDKTLVGRSGILLVQYYLLNLTAFLNHEVAHNISSFQDDKDALEFEWGVMDDFQYVNGLFFHASRNIDASLFYDEELFRTDPARARADAWGKRKLDAYSFAVSAGLNQQEYNLAKMRERFAEENNIFVDEAVSFSVNRLFAMQYIILSKKFWQKFQEPIELYAAQAMLDPLGYLSALKFKGVKISRDTLLLQNAIPVVLSFDTWYTQAIAINYLIAGERAVPNFWLDLGRGKTTLPLFSHYLTPDGSFYNATVFAKLASDSPLFEFQLGTDVDFIGDGKLSTVRLGGKVHAVKLLGGENALMVSPYGFVDFDRKTFATKGGVVGTDIALPLYSNDSASFSIVGSAEFSDSDVLENIVKGEKEGFNFSLGARIRF